MPFSSDNEARQFLAGKIYQESQFHGAPISDVEQRLLMFSVDDPASGEGIPDDEMYDTNVDWERRMTALLKQAWQRDQQNAEERQLYLDAQERLKAGDHYIQVIAGPVFGGSLLRDPNLFAYPVISLKRIALWSAAGIAPFVIIALVCIALTR
jgi:hypothetical protein